MSADAEHPFSNDSVPVDSLPDHTAVEFHPVARTFRRYAMLSTACFFGPAAVIVGVVAAFRVGPVDWLFSAILGGVVALAAITAGFRWLDARYRGWALREHDVLARSGILWRQVTALPIARIQHVETNHGPLERANALARLKLFTAGGMTADLSIIGLERDAADRLREHLVEQIRLRDEGDRAQ